MKQSQDQTIQSHSEKFLTVVSKIRRFMKKQDIESIKQILANETPSQQVCRTSVYLFSAILKVKKSYSHI